MKLMKKNSKKDIEKAVTNLGKYAEELSKQNKEFAGIMKEIKMRDIKLEFDRPITRGKRIVISLREILDIFREHHTREENN